VSIENSGVKGYHILRCESVHVSTEFIGVQGNAPCRPGGGALEDHMLDKVRKTIEFRCIVARAGCEPNSHGHGADMLHALGENGQAIGKDGCANVIGCEHGDLRNSNNE
jgi:hypothetical protein